jgi:hypothetical protein
MAMGPDTFSLAASKFDTSENSDPDTTDVSRTNSLPARV